jgi:hypothetical protein
MTAPATILKRLGRAFADRAAASFKALCGAKVRTRLQRALTDDALRKAGSF